MLKSNCHKMTEINFLYLVTALLFGMLHALEPGHGKSLVATFVLSTKTSSVKDAFLIGLLASATHTTSVYLIGYLGLKILEFISPIDKIIFISFISTIIIFLIGLWLMWDRIIQPLFKHEHEHQCSAHDILTKKLKISSVLLIGLTAGLFPCSGGLAVFMTATAVSGLQNQLSGFLYVLSFSIGLGFALTLVALSMTLGQELIKSILKNSISNIEKSSGVISAILIYTLGLVLLTSNIANLTGRNNVSHKHHVLEHQNLKLKN